MIPAELRRVEASEAFGVLQTLHNDGFNVLVDLTCVDYSALSCGPKGDASDRLKRNVPVEEDALPRPIAIAQDEEVGTPRLPEASAPAHPFLQPRSRRFEVTYRLMKLDAETGQDLGRVCVQVPVGDGDAVLRSVMSLWPIADWLEREVWDMFGVRFSDRPDIKRLLMYESFIGHPLRKDYPITRRQPQVGPASGDLEGSPSFNIVKPGVGFK